MEVHEVAADLAVYSHHPHCERSGKGENHSREHSCPEPILVAADREQKLYRSNSWALLSEDVQRLKLLFGEAAFLPVIHLFIDYEQLAESLDVHVRIAEQGEAEWPY